MNTLRGGGGVTQCSFMINMATVKKTKMIWTYNRVFLCQIHTFGFLKSSVTFFPTVALHDVMKGGTPYMGISPGRTRLRPCTHRPEREQERSHQRTSFARDSLGKNVSREVCFWL